MAIARISACHRFSIRALHVAGVDNPADGPSRGRVQISGKDFTFRFFSDFASAGTTVDCCAAEDGYNAQPGCDLWFSAENPVQLNVPGLLHRAIWAAPPFDIAGQVLDTFVAAWRQAPQDTEATVVLPFDPSCSWFRFYFRRPAPVFRIIHKFDISVVLFSGCAQVQVNKQQEISFQGGRTYERAHYGGQDWCSATVTFTW